MVDPRTPTPQGMGRGKVFPAASARSLLNPARRLVQSPHRTVAAMGLTPTDRVLEVGAGPGFFSPTIAAAVSAGRLVVLDLQPEMASLARKRLAAFPNAEVIVGDAERLPFAGSSFDAVILATMLGEVPDRDRCLSEVHRVVSEGGSVTVAETRRDSDFIPLDELRQLAEGRGLAFGSKRGIRWQYVAQFVKA